MEYARDMDRNDAVIGPLLDTATRNVVQEGLVPDPQTGEPDLDKDLKARWRDWAEDPEQCDHTGEMAFAELEEHASRAVDLDGDILFLPLRTGHLQAVEAHRLRTPSGTKRKVVHGVLLDDNRRRLQYWITKDDIDLNSPLKNVSDIVPINARDDEGQKQVFHVYHPKRISQTRGVTALAPVFDLAGMFEDVQFAKVVQQQIVSCIALFRQRTDGWQGGIPPQHGEVTSELRSDGSTRRVEGWSPGMEILGDPGEELKGFSPQVPNAEYFEHVKLILQLIGINLGLPLVLVLMDASETNFSGWRGAVDQARQGFRRKQRGLVRRFYRPIYGWKLRQWIAEDPTIAAAAERLGKAFFSHRWPLPSWAYIDPLKDAMADLVQSQNSLSSPRRIQAARGHDWDDISTEAVEDRSAAIRKALTAADALNKDFPDAQVGWRDILPLPTAAGTTLALPSPIDEPASAPRKTGA